MKHLRLFDPDGRGPVRERGELTVRELFDLYLTRTRSKQSPRTYEDWERILRRFADEVGDLTISVLIPDHLQSWLDRQTQWRSDWTIHRAVSTIKRPFNWAVKLGLIKTNPFQSITHPTGQRGEPMSDEHYRAMLKNSSPEFRRVLLTIRRTGMRPSELASLRWSDIDVSRAVAVLRSHKTSRTRCDRAPRVVALDQTIVRLLCWLRNRSQGSEVIFLNSLGRPWTRNSLALRLRRQREKCGIPLSVKLYGLRHAWATKLASAGVELATLAALLGHTSTRMAERYIHLAGKTDYLRQELERGLKEGRL